MASLLVVALLGGGASVNDLYESLREGTGSFILNGFRRRSVRVDVRRLLLAFCTPFIHLEIEGQSCCEA